MFPQAYLVLGTALSGPGAVWVLTLQQAMPLLWDPLTGRSSGLGDSSCALREVRHLRSYAATLQAAGKLGHALKVQQDPVELDFV